MVGLLFAVLFVGAIVAFGRIRDLQKDVQDLRNELDAMRRGSAPREQPAATCFAAPASPNRS